MVIVKPSDENSLYIMQMDKGYSCVGCKLVEESKLEDGFFNCPDENTMITHIEDHIAAGDKVMGHLIGLMKANKFSLAINPKEKVDTNIHYLIREANRFFRILPMVKTPELVETHYLEYYEQLEPKNVTFKYFTALCIQDLDREVKKDDPTPDNKKLNPK